ncbi:MAG: LysM peptidoglycan-binding domain-containing protein [Tenacibaculum sp.]|nr:LysM peptidoglycan-binding domain-containing protein [Tenacibaculum sp.]
MYSIARKYNITVNEIYKLNAEFNYDKLREGQEIIVGYDKTKEGKVIYEVDEDAYTNKDKNSHYVKKGETLFSISRKYYITVDKLKRYNNLKSNTIKIGQKLRIVPF